MVLLGVLAQIEAVLFPLVQTEEVAVTAQPKMEGPAIPTEVSSASIKAEVLAEETHDFGVAISRDEMLSPGQVKREKLLGEKKRASAVVSVPDKPQQIAAETAKPKKDKKKKKRRKGDEFDDLFSSLM